MKHQCRDFDHIIQLSRPHLAHLKGLKDLKILHFDKEKYFKLKKSTSLGLSHI
jgi:hypothetical protein